MTELKYFPVIDMSGDGTQMAAMFPTNNESRASDCHKAYLEEITPYSFRLYAKIPVSHTVSISCPYCGASLLCLYEGNGTRTHSVYRCPKCR